MTASGVAAREFRREYAAHRAAEGRGRGADVLELPYPRGGALARQWRVRARSYETFVRVILRPLAASHGGGLRLLDLGAGNGWLSRRVAMEGHEAVALDVREDRVDGLGAAADLLSARPGLFQRVAASFDALPFPPRHFDLAVFNASLHYALDLGRVLGAAAAAVRAGGRIVILDSPFYATEQAGAAMVSEKRREASTRFGDRAEALLGLPFIEFLTADRLRAAYPELSWRRHRVRYPLWYELRPLTARFWGRRPPSRFDLWECAVP